MSLIPCPFVLSSWSLYIICYLTFHISWFSFLWNMYADICHNLLHRILGSKCFTGIISLIVVFFSSSHIPQSRYASIILVKDQTEIGLFTFLLWEGIILAYVTELCLHMDPYVVTFHIGSRIGVIGPEFDISIICFSGSIFTSSGFYWIKK